MKKGQQLLQLQKHETNIAMAKLRFLRQATKDNTYNNIYNKLKTLW